MVSGICIRIICVCVCVCVCVLTVEESRLAINCQSLKLGKTVCMGPNILFSCECLKLSIIKKKIVNKRNAVVWTPRKCLWVAWGCVWPKRHILFGFWDCFLKKKIFFFFSFWIQHLKMRRLQDFQLLWKHGNDLATRDHSSKAWSVAVPTPSPWHSPTDNSLPRSAISWDWPRAQHSSEPWHSANLRSRASRIHRFHWSAQTTLVLFSDQ